MCVSLCVCVSKAAKGISLPSAGKENLCKLKKWELSFIPDYFKVGGNLSRGMQVLCNVSSKSLGGFIPTGDSPAAAAVLPQTEQAGIQHCLQQYQPLIGRRLSLPHSKLCLAP